MKEKLRFTALWLCGVIIVFFALQQIFGTGHFILEKELIFSEPLRLVTAIFSHGSVGHLLSNLFALGLFGLILEGRIGPKRVLGLFLLSGFLINLFMPYQKSLGASGAIYAILGTLIVLRPWLMIWVYSMPMPMIIAGLIWLIQDVVGTFLPTGIGHLAHLGGLAIGIIYGLTLRKEYSDKPKKKIKLTPEELKKVEEWENINLSERR